MIEKRDSKEWEQKLKQKRIYIIIQGRFIEVEISYGNPPRRAIFLSDPNRNYA